MGRTRSNLRASGGYDNRLGILLSQSFRYLNVDRIDVTHIFSSKNLIIHAIGLIKKCKSIKQGKDRIKKKNKEWIILLCVKKY
jgi:hypothetical protein